MLASDIPSIIKIGWDVLRRQIPYYPMVASFDVTSRCTLKCKHCYWWEQDRGKELSDDEYFNKVKELKQRHPTIVSAVWLGGEPLLRSELVEKCLPLFSFNEVITNGTRPLPNWKKVRFAVSVDGTKKYHERQRGLGCYDRIKENINRDDLNVNIICIITKLNQECLEDMAEEWSQTKIKSMGFGFYTPILGKDNNDIWIDFKERDKVLKRIEKLKKKYGSFINTTEATLKAFRSENSEVVTNSCRRDYAPYGGMCFDSTFRRKFPCVIGEKADCSKCGCTASTMGESVKNGDISFMWGHIRAKMGI